MSVFRQFNWLPQMRVDLPHLRTLESSIVADFDGLMGQIWAGRKSYVISGLSIPVIGIGSNANSLTLTVAGAVITHFKGSEAGSMYIFPAAEAAQVLAATNPKVIGSFSPSQTNYVGLDLRRVTDSSSTDIMQFLDADTKLETAKIVSLARILDYRILITTSTFTSQAFVLPIAQVITDGSNNVTSITDARPMLFRLGSGGDFPDVNHIFPWATRSENAITASSSLAPDPFFAGDKELLSMKDWQDSVMTRLWELGGGQKWFSLQSDRDIKVAYTGSSLVSGQNYEFDSGSGVLKWSGINIVFGNSPAIYNVVQDNIGGSVVADGSCLYVDVVRGTNASVLVGAIAPLTTVGGSAVPGQRFILAWRRGSNVYTRDAPYPVGHTILTQKRKWSSAIVMGPGSSVGVTNTGGDVALALDNVANKVYLALPPDVPVGALITKVFVFGSFTGAVTTQKLRMVMRKNDAFSDPEATFVPTANPQVIGASTIVQVTGVAVPNVPGAYIEWSPSTPITVFNPNIGDITQTFRLMLLLTCDVAGAGSAFIVKGVGIEYSETL